MLVCAICCLYSSDYPIFSLDPVEPVAFDASRLQGVTASHLTSLMNLTFTGDEKLASNPLFPRPPSPAKVSADMDSERKSADLDSECLEKQLDEDMARTLAEDVSTNDHNADKKFGAGTQTDSHDGAVTQTSSVTGVPGTAATFLSSVLRDEHSHECSVDITGHPATGLYCPIDRECLLVW